MNSEGLQVNTLFYPSMVMEPVTNTSQITQFTFGEYLLANYASVTEVVEALPTLDFGRLSLQGMPMEMNLHWSVTDKSGDRLVIEMDEGRVNTYRGEEAMVMTNDPSLQQHLDQRKEVVSSWENADRDTDYGSIGIGNAHSRFLHASYFANKLTEPTSVNNAMMKLSTVPYRVPADAPYMDFGNAMMGYATEWILTQSLETDDSVFEYNWNTVRVNIYSMMGKEFRIPLDKSFMVQL
ncbi:linear amide C-N hydrolase [Photobacterium lutimaris]|uniref:linear amide C-N hydrolase n=1 Tax=Photobacterium lutimaris TaxID=388278 RepID=UPI0010E17645|nr:linear amide C-N hydrolase [Photobacterium lutimaris]TDR77186.1 linear amide C-N hydrolase (choloylglycine hydrolase family) [Photobacterium lutimaris]